MLLPKLLYVDDEAVLRSAIRRALSREYEVSVTENGTKALELLKDNEYDIILSDIEMPSMDGVALYEAVAKAKPEMTRRFVLCSGGYNQATAKRLNAIPSAPKILPKPCGLEKLKDTLASVLSQNEK